MGQGMDGMNESWEPEDAEEDQQRRGNTLLPEPQRLRIEADGLFKRAKKAEEKNKSLTAERDQLRAEVNRLQGYNESLLQERDSRITTVAGLRAEVADCIAGGKHWSSMYHTCEPERAALATRVHHQREEINALQSTAAGLRRALEEVNDAICVTRPSDIANGVLKAFQLINTALAATSDNHERRIKSEALREGLLPIISAYRGDATGCNPQCLLDALLALLAEADRLEGANATTNA